MSDSTTIKIRCQWESVVEVQATKSERERSRNAVFMEELPEQAQDAIYMSRGGRLMDWQVLP